MTGGKRVKGEIENKHQKRMRKEIAAPGTPPSLLKEVEEQEAGSEGFVDLISVIADEPKITRVSQSAYNGLCSGDGTVYLRDLHSIWMFNDPPALAVAGPWHTVGLVPTRQGQVFDLTNMAFACTVPAAAPPAISIWAAVPDWAFSGIFAMRVAVDGIAPWQGQSVLNFPAPFAQVFPGFYAKLNDPWLSDFGDCPVHLIAQEGQTMTFDIAQVLAAPGNPTLVFPGGSISVQVSGRMVPSQHYRRVLAANNAE